MGCEGDKCCALAADAPLEGESDLWVTTLTRCTRHGQDRVRIEYVHFAWLLALSAFQDHQRHLHRDIQVPPALLFRRPA